MASATTILTAWAATLISAAQASPASLEHRAAPAYHDFQIPITATANNKLIYSPTHDLTTVDGVTSFLSSGAGALGQLIDYIPRTLTAPLSARYCPPSTNAAAPSARAKTVQLLLHGIPYNKDYWSGLPSDPAGSAQYSYISAATSAGYPVLAIDNLGNGNSTTHPNPITQVQQPLETEFVHQLITKLRAGSVGHGVPKADKVIYVGHSYASVLGNALMSKHPSDIDAAVLTGYSYTIANAVPGVLLALLAPASVVYPDRFGHLSPGYITFASEEGKRNSYYAADGDFDPAVAHYDYEHQDVTTIGSIATFFSGLQKAEAFKGSVFALTGEEDALFCGLGSRAIEVPNCGSAKSGIVARSGKEFFPAAKKFGLYLPVGTSHATNLAKGSAAGFKQALQFLAGQGF